MVIKSVPRKLEIEPWQQWFAWYPVKTIGGNKTWFRYVYRRSVIAFFDMDKFIHYEYGTLIDLINSND